jgi:hypothetical protein
MLSDQPYRYLTVDEMKSLGDDSLPIDVTRDERVDSNRECMGKYIKLADDYLVLPGYLIIPILYHTNNIHQPIYIKDYTTAII